ncbi:hypothetical protein ACW73L_12455 [Methylolobus aquaticus]
MNASTTDNTTVALLPHLSAVPIIMPSTSPMAQPERQWAVALKAIRLSEDLAAAG